MTPQEAKQLKPGFKDIVCEWYEKGKFYKMGSEYAGKYTPAVEIPESVGGCLAPNVSHGYVSFKYRYWDPEKGTEWARAGVSFYNKQEFDEFKEWIRARYDNTPNPVRLMEALSTIHGGRANG